MRGHAFGWVASGHSITVLVRAYWVVSKRNCAWLFTNWDLVGPSGHRSAESASPGHRVPSGVTIGWVEKHLLRLLAPRPRRGYAAEGLGLPVGLPPLTSEQSPAGSRGAKCSFPLLEPAGVPACLLLPKSPGTLPCRCQNGSSN